MCLCFLGCIILFFISNTLYIICFLSDSELGSIIDKKKKFKLSVFTSELGANYKHVPDWSGQGLKGIMEAVGKKIS